MPLYDCVHKNIYLYTILAFLMVSNNERINVILLFRKYADLCRNNFDSVNFSNYTSDHAWRMFKNNIKSLRSLVSYK